jgi:hypothetical protein
MGSHELLITELVFNNILTGNVVDLTLLKNYAFISVSYTTVGVNCVNISMIADVSKSCCFYVTLILATNLPSRLDYLFVGTACI